MLNNPDEYVDARPNEFPASTRVHIHAYGGDTEGMAARLGAWLYDEGCTPATIEYLLGAPPLSIKAAQAVNFAQLTTFGPDLVELLLKRRQSDSFTTFLSDFTHFFAQKFNAAWLRARDVYDKQRLMHRFELEIPPRMKWVVMERDQLLGLRFGERPPSREDLTVLHDPPFGEFHYVDGRRAYNQSWGKGSSKARA